MKKLTIILLVIISIIFFSYLYFDRVYPLRRVGRHVYDEDYTIIYESTFDVMFDNEWTVKSVEERFDMGEEACGCGIPGINPHTFLVWTIEYRDGNGDIRHFEFHNRSSLSGQIEGYVSDYIADYYKENFYDIYITDIPLAPSSRVSGFYVKASVNVHNEENQEWKNKTEEYREGLLTPEGAIRLSQLTPANVFEIFPMYLSISVSISGSSSLTQSIEERAMKQVEDMIDEMNRFTNNSLNTVTRIGYHEILELHTGKRSYSWYYIRGEQVFDIEPMYFGRDVFESYRGLFR